MKKYTQIMGWVVQTVGALNLIIWHDIGLEGDSDPYFNTGFILIGIGVLVTAFGCSMVKEST